MTLVLTATAVVTGGLLAFVNAQTKDTIQQQKDKELQDGIKNVVGDPNLTVSKTDTIVQDNNGKDQTYVIYNATSSEGKPLGAAVESTVQGFGGDVRILVGFDNEGVIKGYTILEHAETPGLGAKAGDWFQKGEKGDIIGKDPSKGNLVVSKDDDKAKNKVDAITAATITSRAFLNGVNQAYQAYSINVLTDKTDAHSGATKQDK